MSANIFIFRAWDRANNQMITGKNLSVLAKNMADSANKQFIFMQVVEINTSFNRTVFEGDIIKAYRRDDGAQETPCFSEVTMLNGCFMAFNCTWHELYRLWQSDFEVVGNIYQNLELLKNGK